MNPSHEAFWPQRPPAPAEAVAGDLYDRAYLTAKRAVDLALCVVALALGWPLLLLIALLVRLDSPGPAFFTQQRVGARWRRSGGRVRWEIVTFGCHKFRTMAQDCDQTPHRAFIEAFIEGRSAASALEGLPYKLSDDRRVTRLGRWLRKTSLDELPQLVNILKGEMSLVGPRPVPVYEVAAYRPWHRERLLAVPGLTGLWQVKGRSRVSFDEMVRLDIAYVRARSLGLDFRLLLGTIPAALRGRGAQ